MTFVYVISSVVRRYVYVGMTDNLARRLKDHQSGNNKTTKPYRPFELVLSEEFNSKVEAREREKYLKSGVGKEFLKSILLDRKP